MTELLQRADFELALLIGVVLIIVVALALLARRSQPAPTAAGPATTSSAVPADLAAIEAKMKALDGRVSEVEHGVNQVRTMMRALPTKDSVNSIALEVKELKGDIKLNNFQTATTAKAVERIENWLMEEARLKAEMAKAEALKKAEGEKGDIR